MTFEAHGSAHSCALDSTSEAATLPAAVIEQLLVLLADDDGYRARFEANPREALREIGYVTPAGDVGVFGRDPVMAFSYFHGGLASKEKIAAGRTRWLAQLRANEQIFGPFSMCA